MIDHAKTPWLLNPKVEHKMPDGEASHFTRRIVTESMPRQHVVTLDFGYGSINDDVNTDHIIRACNNFDSMLEALRKAYVLALQIDYAEDSDGNRIHPDAVLAIVQEAISKAEAK